MVEPGGNPLAGRPQALILAKGWRQVEPRPVHRTLLWEASGQLQISQTDFSQPHAFGQVGSIDCPIAVDPVRRLAYRYICPDGAGRDFSEIVAFHLDLGTKSRLFRLGLNQWIVWMFQYLPKEDVLLALLATDMPGEELRIQHQLGLFDLKHSRRLQVPLPRDAFCPVDLHENRREILFHGAEGWQIITFSGKRVAHLRSRAVPLGRGGALHPNRPLAALGGGGIALWNRQRNAIQTLHRQGQQPAWSPDGKVLYFSESSSDLFQHTLANGQTERIFSIAGNRQAEVTRARRPALTSDGRWLALPITRKLLRREAPAGETRFTFSESLVVADLEQKEIWQYTAPAHHPAWYEPLDYGALTRTSHVRAN